MHKRISRAELLGETNLAFENEDKIISVNDQETSFQNSTSDVDRDSERKYSGDLGIVGVFRQFVSQQAVNILDTESRTSDSSIPTLTDQERSRDWLFITLITLVLSILDKCFDISFIVTLKRNEEWDFFGVSVFFVVASTALTSLLAAQR